MYRDHRIDDALRAIAQADASGGFSARVRGNVAASGAGNSKTGHAAWWPRLAAASATGLIVVAAIWWPRETPVSPTAHVAPRTAQPVVARSEPLPRVEPRDESHNASARVLPVRVSGAAARTRGAIEAPGDHDLALEPLAALTAIALPSIDPPAVIVADDVVVPLAPVAPLRVHEMPGNLEKGAL